jgi:hypothetical protein
MDNREFRQIMDRCGYSLDGMAKQLDLSRRLVASYRGTLPIPNHVAFAMRYLVIRFGDADAEPAIYPGHIEPDQVVSLDDERRRRMQG